jgi:hypothetical protein
MSRPSGVEATKDEVLSLLRKWLDDGAALECRISFPRAGIWGRLRGRAREVSPEGFLVLSSDDTSELKLLFESCVAFLFTDARDVVSERGRFEGTLIFVLRFDDDGLNDIVSLSEVVNPA